MATPFYNKKNVSTALQQFCRSACQSGVARDDIACNSALADRVKAVGQRADAGVRGVPEAVLTASEMSSPVPVKCVTPHVPAAEMERIEP